MSSLNLHQNPKQKNLERAWEGLLSDPKLAEAVEQETRKRAIEFLKGVSQYQKTPFARDVEEPPEVMRVGAARLLDYGSKSENAPVVFLIPSLINRYYILDLTQKLSFARYLRGQDIRVFIVDWGTPSAAEHHFNCALYTTEILTPMTEWIRTHSKGKITLGGYCMGGLLAIALAQIRPDLVNSLALFSTPWDFSVSDFPRLAVSGAEIETMQQYINAHELFPAETIHTLFHCANPYAFQTKLREFSHMRPEQPETQEFLAVEHWVNDGVPMTRGVANDCLVEWSLHNKPMRKEWHVGGQVIDPARLRLPSFVAAPQDDKIVPYDSAISLVPMLKDCTLIEPRSGHVSMIVGSRRKLALWEPFCNWLTEVHL